MESHPNGTKAVLSKKDRRNLERAKNLAAGSLCKNKHGAVVVSGGRVIGSGSNKERNDPRWVDSPKTQAAIHAEIAALRACGSTSVKGGTIYVARVNRAGDELMSRPCERCQNALRDAGIRKIVYTISREMDL